MPRGISNFTRVRTLTCHLDFAINYNVSKYQISSVNEGFRYLEHITDAYIETCGHSLSEAFDYAGRALVNLMFDIGSVNGQIPITIHTEGSDEIELLYNWLEKVLLVVLIEGQVMSKFKVRIYPNSKYVLEARAMTELIDTLKHGYRTEVKGITYHEMEVTQCNDLVRTRFIVDL